MSAFIAAIYGDCIQILTDAAGYDTSGTLRAVIDKCWYSERLPMAITGRGNAFLIEGFAKAAVEFADSATSIEEVCRWLEGAVARAKARSSEVAALSAHFEIVFAAFHETAGFQMRVFTTNEMSGYAPYEWHSVDGMLVGAPDVQPKDVLAITAQMPATDPRFLPTFGVQLMELMRLNNIGKVSMWHENAALSGTVVGGNCRLTTITQRGVELRVLKTWDDPLHETINPYREAGNVAVIGSRKERRAQKSAQRKSDGKRLRA